MSVLQSSRPGWAEVLAFHAADGGTGRRVIAQLRACEASALAFCRLLERWARGDADPCTPGKRQAAFRRAAERVETALMGLEEPLGRYLLELEPDEAEGASWYSEPSAAEFVEWEPVLSAPACPSRRPASRARTWSWPSSSARSKVLPRPRSGMPSRTGRRSGPGLFDLRENLMGGAAQDLRALAA